MNPMNLNPIISRHQLEMSLKLAAYRLAKWLQHSSPGQLQRQRLISKSRPKCDTCHKSAAIGQRRTRPPL